MSDSRMWRRRLAAMGAVALAAGVMMGASPAFAVQQGPDCARTASNSECAVGAGDIPFNVRVDTWWWIP